jgi:hypothetical protein
MSKKANVSELEVQILRNAFEGLEGRQPKSDQVLKEWLATDEGKQATMFESTLLSRWGEIGHA